MLGYLNIKPYLYLATKAFRTFSGLTKFVHDVITKVPLYKNIEGNLILSSIITCHNMNGYTKLGCYLGIKNVN